MISKPMGFIGDQDIIHFSSSILMGRNRILTYKWDNFNDVYQMNRVTKTKEINKTQLWAEPLGAVFWVCLEKGTSFQEFGQQ